MRDTYLLVASSLALALVAACTDASTDPEPSAPEPPTSPARSEAKTWSGYFGEHAPDAKLTIPMGKTLSLDVCDTEFFSLTVMGTLNVDEATADACPDAAMTARTVVVMGQSARLAFGAEDVPYAGKFTLTLTGDALGEKTGMAEQRQLMVMGGATLYANGASAAKTSWTSLESTIAPFATAIAVEDPSGWEAGDELVIASSTMDPREAERVVVRAVKGDEIWLEQPTFYHHFGRKLSYGGKVIDQRAEVGLLSHNIVIQGDEGSLETGIGGNVMVMNQTAQRPDGGVNGDLLRPDYEGRPSRAYVQGVEFRRMGQRGRQGRYPFHWHLTDDGAGQYVKRSSVHESLQRAVNVHGTDDVTVEEVVAYDVFNHVFVPSEEGDEVRNAFRRNLGILSKRVADEDFAFPQDNLNQPSEQSENRASVFWMRNPFNPLHDNRAAGAWFGQGFFIDPRGHNQAHFRLALEANGYEQREVCDFRGNIAHSIYARLGSPDLYEPRVRGFGLFLDTEGERITKGPFKDQRVTCTLTDFQAYKTQHGGAWIENDTILDGAIVTDSHTGVVSGNVLRGVVVVGQSENDLPSGGIVAIGGQGGAFTVPSAPERSRGGFMQSANGGHNMRGRDFADLACIGMPACFNNQGMQDGVVGQYEDAAIDGVALTNTPQGFVVGWRSANGEGVTPFMDGRRPRLGLFTDVDGMLTGTPGSQASMDAGRFLELSDPQEMPFGWLWEEVPLTRSDPVPSD